MSVSVDDVEALRSILSALPRHQPKQVSKQDAIASLVSELGAAQRRGYSADDLARLLSERGIEINGPTLRNCLRRLRKKRLPRDKTKASEMSAGTAPAPPSVSTGQKAAPAQHGTDAGRPPASFLARDPVAARPMTGAEPAIEARVTQK